MTDTAPGRLLPFVRVPVLRHAIAQRVCSADNMRTSAGTRHDSLWLLSRGYPLQVIGKRGKWVKVRDFESDEGWVYRPLTSARPHHVVKASTANVRSGPGTRTRVIGRHAYGEVVRTLE